MNRYLFFLILLPVLGCTPNRAEMPDLNVVWEKSILRESPELEAKELASLSQGEKVFDTGKISSEFSEVMYQNKAFDAPWIQVKLTNGVTGWIFAASLSPISAAPSSPWLDEKKFLSVFGATISAEKNAWTHMPTKNEQEVSERFGKSMALRVKMQQAMESYTTKEVGKGGDWFWLNSQVPGFVLQQNTEGAPVSLFLDFRYWYKSAAQSTGVQDDLYMNFCQHLFPADSIESPFPRWKFPVSLTESFSLLGAGEHKNTLEQLALLRKKCPLFEQELGKWYDAVLEDILNPKVAFWQPAPKAVEELQKILALPQGFVLQNDKTALAEKLKMLQNPEENGLTTNARAGK